MLRDAGTLDRQFTVGLVTRVIVHQLLPVVGEILDWRRRWGYLEFKDIYVFGIRIGYLFRKLRENKRAKANDGLVGNFNYEGEGPGSIPGPRIF